MTDATPALRRSRAPTGCNASPLYISLRPDERKRVDELAARDERSVSATARLLLLRGLAAAEHNPHQSLAS